MKRLYIPLILFLLLVLEGVALELLPTKLVISDLLIIPHWVLVFLIMISISYDTENTYFSVLYGVIFGLLIDVVYTGILGVYMFTYAFSVYFVHGLKKMLHANLFVTVLLGIIAITITDVSIYLIFSVVGITDIRWLDYLNFRLIPTLIANLVFLLAIYPFFKNKLVKWRTEQLSSNDSL